MSPDYYGNIRTLLRFLTRDGEDGYAFATARHEGLIPAVNRELIQQAEDKQKRIEEVWYEPDEDKTFAETLRQAVSEANALIVMGLDRPLQENKDFIVNLNFAREAINTIGKPVLLWLNPESLTIVTNQAADLFSQRRISTVQFEEAPEIVAPAPELERRFREEYRSSEDYEKLRNRVNLLKKQLAEATEAEIPRQRIARDIVLPLAETYSELDLHEEALWLLEEYKDEWDGDDARELYKRGGILWGANRYSDAIGCLEKAGRILDSVNKDSELLADIYTDLGDIYHEIGTFDRTLQNYEKNFKLREAILSENTDSEECKHNLVDALNRLGHIFQKQGKLENALAFFEKALLINEEIHAANTSSVSAKNYLASSYLWLGSIYESLGKLNKALELIEKSLQHREQLFEAESRKDNLAMSYNRMGSIYEKQGKLNKAMESFEKSLQLREELCAINSLSENLKNDLASSYGWIGGIYHTQGKLNKALEYYEKSLQLRKELYATNPISERAKRNLAVSYNWVGSIYHSQNKSSKTLESFEKNCQLLEELYAHNPLSEDIKRELALSYAWLGDLLTSHDKIRKSLEFYERSHKLWKNLQEDNPLSEDLKYNLISSYSRISIISNRSGKWFKAIRYSWNELVTTWQLCRYLKWSRYKMRMLISFSNFFVTIILPPPFSIILLWLSEKIDSLYKRFRYGPDK